MYAQIALRYLQASDLDGVTNRMQLMWLGNYVAYLI